MNALAAGGAPVPRLGPRRGVPMPEDNRRSHDVNPDDLTRPLTPLRSTEFFLAPEEQLRRQRRAERAVNSAVWAVTVMMTTLAVAGLVLDAILIRYLVVIAS